MTRTLPLVLTFSATDPTAGAGLQADVLTLSSLGVHALNIVTAVTAQNTVGVMRVDAVSPKLIAAQLQSLMDDGVQIAAIKVGVVANAAAIDAILAAKTQWPDAPLVLDPVKASGRGDALVSNPVWKDLKQRLLLQVDILTPNWPEAAALAGLAPDTSPDLLAEHIFALGPKAIVLKGGHAPQTASFMVKCPQNDAQHSHIQGHIPSNIKSLMVHRLYPSVGLPAQLYACEHLEGSYHGSGCTLASAISAALAHGMGLSDAVALGLEYTHQALQHGFSVGQGQYIPDRLHLMQQAMRGMPAPPSAVVCPQHDDVAHELIPNPT